LRRKGWWRNAKWEEGEGSPERGVIAEGREGEKESKRKVGERGNRVKKRKKEVKRQGRGPGEKGFEEKREGGKGGESPDRRL